MKKGKLILFLLLAVFIVGVLNVEKLAKSMYPYKYERYINVYSNKYNVDPYLICAVIKAESNFDEYAKSHKDARGLMQLTPETAKWISKKMEMENFDEDMLYKPEINISMGCWYVKDLEKEFNKDIDLILASYNAGRGNVAKWLGNEKYSKDGKTIYYIPFKETDKYIKKVKVNYKVYKSLYGKEKKSKIKILKLVLENW